MALPRIISSVLFGLILCGCYVGKTHGQNHYRKQILKYIDGLPSDYVYAAISDSSGYLYIASQGGLSIYDGYRFMDHTSTQWGVTDLFLDGDNFYFYDERGLNRLKSIYAEPELLIANTFTDSDPNNDEYHNIFLDKKGRIWSTDFNYVKYYIPENDKVTSFLIDPDSKDLNINIDILEVSEGRIWVPAKSGLWVWDETVDKLNLHPLDEINRFSYEAAVQMDAREVILATADGELIRINPVTQQFEYLPSLPDGDLVTGFQKTKRELLFYSSQKIYCKEKDNYQEIYSTDNAIINSVSFDPRTNLLWVSTTKGLVKLTPVPEAIDILQIPEIIDNNNPVASIVEQREDELWVLTKLGNVWFFRNGIWDKRFYNDPTLECFALDEVGHQIMLSTNKGVFLWENNRFEPLDLPNLDIKSTIRKVLVTPQNEFWIVFSEQKIKRYHYPGFEEISREFHNDNSFWADNKWNDILVDNKGTVWLAGWMPKDWGINRYDPAKNEFVQLSDSTINKKPIDVFIGDYYNSIGLAANDKLLFSGYGGWNRADEKGRIIQKVDMHDYKIADTYIVGISENKHGNVFFGTREGLHIWLKDKDRVVRVSQIDGLPTDYLINAHKKLHNGKIALGITNGILLIDTKKILQTPLTNRLKLTQTRINGVLKNNNSTHIELSNNESDLSLYFSDLSYLNPYRVNYRYKYSDNDYWHDLGHNPELSLHHIAPGEYNIIIEVLDNLANRQEKTLSIFVKAPPAWWQTWWFRIPLLFAVIGLVTFIVRRRIQNIRYNAEMKQKIAETELVALRAQMNPHFIFNCINSIDALIQSNDKYQATVYLNKFAKLLRNVLDTSKQNTVTFSKDLETLQLYIDLEQLRNENKFTSHIEADHLLLQDDYKVPPLVVQPYVENAILHGLKNRAGSDGKLRIIVTKQGEDIKYIIEDNGVGRNNIKESPKHNNSYGMQMSSERVRFFNNEETASVVVTDLERKGKPAGTRVEVLLKVR